MRHSPLANKTVVIIPAYRESGRVGSVVREVLGMGLGLDVVVIDDGSPDATAHEARAAGADVVSHPYNLGYGCALHTGYCRAWRAGYDRVLQMDADGQHEPAMLARLVAALDAGADVVLGSRYLDDQPPPTSLAKRLATRMFAAIATRWTGMRITDPTSGFQGLSRAALECAPELGFSAHCRYELDICTREVNRRRANEQVLDRSRLCCVLKWRIAEQYVIDRAF